MASIFTKIVNGEIPCYKIAEDDRFLAFLDIMPLQEGHVLVIPKQETNHLFDIDDQDLSDMMVFAKRIAQKMRSILPCKRIGVAVIGLEVPHAHIHLIPINKMDDMNFANPKLELSQAALQAMAERLRM